MEKYQLVTYNDNYYKLICFKEHEKKEKKGFLRNEDKNEEETQRCSLSRTKRNIKEIALCNNFEYFATLTINSQFGNRFDLQECQDRLKKIFKRIKRNNKGFKYVFITEKHKNGAFHFHGLIGGYNAFYINDNGYLSSKDFDEMGFNSFSIIKDYNKCCNYILKYITKDCVKNENNQIYISSRGLKKANRDEIMPININNYGRYYENDFLKQTEFDISELSKTDLCNLFYNLKTKKEFLLTKEKFNV